MDECLFSVHSALPTSHANSAFLWGCLCCCEQLTVSTGSAWLCGVGVALQGHPGQKSDSTTLILTINMLGQSSNCSKTRGSMLLSCPAAALNGLGEHQKLTKTLNFFKEKSLFSLMQYSFKLVFEFSRQLNKHNGRWSPCFFSWHVRSWNVQSLYLHL